MPGDVIGVAGNLSRPSKTRALVELLVDRIAAAHGRTGRVFDPIDFGPSLGAASRATELPDAGRGLLEAIIAADVLVVASPVYKGSYTGLFKHLFDLIDADALDRQAGAARRYRRRGPPRSGDRASAPAALRLLPGGVLPSAVYATERDFADGLPRFADALERLDRAVAQFASLLRGRRSGSPLASFPRHSADAGASSS